MSFILHSDLGRQQQRAMTQTPQGYSREYNSPDTELGHTAPSNTASYPLHQHIQPVSWSPGEPRGLGLYSTPLNIDQFRPMCSIDTPVDSMNFSWPSSFVPNSHTLLSSAEVHKRESWSDCDPMSAMLPSATWHGYDQHQSSEPMNLEDQPSPSQSEYSASSRPSYTSSPYSHQSNFMPTAGSPKVKTEESMDFGSEALPFLSEAINFEHSKLVNPGDLVTNPPMSYSRSAFAINPSYNDLLGVRSIPSSGQRPGTQRALSSDSAFSILEDRQKRGFTKPENASCSCDKCGKLFQRSYNLKAHMETHDPHRSQPHVCQYAGCSKRFVRRTDLLRHEQSVHVKAKNYSCPLCDSSFARKDTLRRHVDDGCPRRPEVKKRISKSSLRRSSNASSIRTPSLQQLARRSLSTSPLRQPLKLR
ncbi:hypothetical protein K431DRAFT_284727 [Polychaeton citri CBS 116435]|uniref:C2H2-type domain-containing protein n=1 Tax=Polychaeton citri CBS 116435 TaxID=1314669 RepID=A0A9P4Q8K7_9PEZI|nr:hypothetical protein K431DRAFT_284727 [Polychaeton citri CBS 116435]